MPDLVLVIADGGAEGYVYSDELNGPLPSSPAEALAWQAEGRFDNRVLPVYESDGVTQIGTYPVG